MERMRGIPRFGGYHAPAVAMKDISILSSARESLDAESHK
jgi:hypothetical protein